MVKEMGTVNDNEQYLECCETVEWLYLHVHLHPIREYQTVSIKILIMKWNIKLT